MIHQPSPLLVDSSNPVRLPPPLSAMPSGKARQKFNQLARFFAQRYKTMIGIERARKDHSLLFPFYDLPGAL